MGIAMLVGLAMVAVAQDARPAQAMTNDVVLHHGTCAPPTCVRYIHHPTLRKTCCGCDYCCLPPIQVVVTVVDPNCCTRCLDIPLCLPACCCDVPVCSSHCGLLGRGTVSYAWCCGYKVDVVFKRNGDVVVHSYGR